MKTVAFVPIKLNSQRLPHKNILPIGNHPLCYHIVNSLLQSKGIDEVYVYCSDEAVKQYIPENAIFKKRDKRLDGDLVKGFDIYRSFINEVDADVYVLAHTTSPFIKVTSIETALSKILEGKNDSAFSAERIQTFAWYKGKPINYDLKHQPRSQDLPDILALNFAVSILGKQTMIDCKNVVGMKPYIFPIDEVEATDIDNQIDFDFAEFVYKSTID